MYCIDCYTRLGRAKGGRCPACGCAFDPADPSSYAHETNTLKMRVIARTVGSLAFIISLLLLAFLQRAVIEASFGADYIHISIQVDEGLFAVPDPVETPHDYFALQPSQMNAGFIRWTLAAPAESEYFTAAYLPPASGVLILLQLLALAVLAWKLAATAHRRTLFWLEAEAELNSTAQTSQMRNSRAV